MTVFWMLMLRRIARACVPISLALRYRVISVYSHANIAALNLVLDLAENFANLVFDGVGAGRLLLEAVQVRKELPVHEVAEIVAGQGLVMVELAVLVLGRGPTLPSIGLVEDIGVFLAVPARPRDSCPAPRSSRYFRNSSQEVCSV